jgi:hypothetical protein
VVTTVGGAGPPLELLDELDDELPELEDDEPPPDDEELDDDSGKPLT